MTSSLRFGLNIDHVATVRNARGGTWPDPIEAARIGIDAGVDGITAHLREDRRHIRDEDIARLRATISKPLNFEMGATESMLEIALATRPHAVCLVPERREERTTEGGLDVIGRAADLKPMITRLTERGIRVSLFIEPSLHAVEQAWQLGAPVVELHTGAWCHAEERADSEAAHREFARIVDASRLTQEVGLECHAGHGLNYDTARRVSALPEIKELNIGHFVIGEAIMVGLATAVTRMRQAMDQGFSQRADR